MGDDQKAVPSVSIEDYRALKAERDELKDKVEQLEGTAQNAFERWQKALQREESLNQKLEKAVGIIKRSISYIGNGVPVPEADDELVQRIKTKAALLVDSMEALNSIRGGEKK